MKQTKVMSAQEYAQGKELVKRLCNLFGGNFVPDIPVPAEENLAVCETGENEVLPKRAWVLLKRARKGGLLDENWQPKCSLTEAALLAQMISFDVWGGRRWKPFEELWGVKRLCKSFDKATFLKKLPAVEKKMGEILRIL